MINVLFFAQFRETLEIERLEIEEPVSCVAELRRLLQQKGEHWHEILATENSLAAVNQTMAADHVLIKSNDEVAFFPPVTGG